MLAAASIWLVTGCHSMGPRQLPIDRFDYNSAIANSANEQMLLNLVRLRFNEVPVFLAVNSVLTQYVWSGEVGIAGTSGRGNGFPAWTVGGSSSYRYFERPTVTYSPLTGQEFASQLISPVRADMVFSLVSSGWPPDQLLIMTLQRINDVVNHGFSWTDHPGSTAGEFSRAVNLVIELSKRNAIELLRAAGPDQDETLLDFAANPDDETQKLITEFKDLLGLKHDQTRFRVTRKIVGRGPGEITLRMHSLLELMGLLSTGIEEPGEHARTESTTAANDSNKASVPMRVYCVPERPTDALVTVEFRGHWYYIANDDQESKRAFGLLNYLFQMQATQNQGAGPLLTVPVG